MVTDLPGQIHKLGVTVRVGAALQLFGGGLQRIAHGGQLPPHGVSADLMTHRHQRIGQIARRLGGPPQRTHWVAPGLRLHQTVQMGQQLCVGVGQPLTARPPTTHRRSQIDSAVDLTHRTLHRGTRHPRSPCHHRDPAPAKRPRLRPRQHPTLPLI